MAKTDLLDDTRQNERYDPAASSFNDIVNNSFSPQEQSRLSNDAQAMGTNAEAGVRNAEQAAGTRSDQQANQTPADKAVGAAGDLVSTLGKGNMVLQAAGRMLKSRKKSVVLAAIVIIIVAMIGGTLGPASILISIKENITNLMGRNNEIATSHFMRAKIKQRWFNDPDACRGTRMYCNITAPGMEKSQIEKMKKSGVFQDMETRKASNGKYHIVSIKVSTGGDKFVTVTGDNFDRMHRTNPHVMSAVNKVYNPRTYIRGPSSLKMFGKIGITRSAPEKVKTMKERVQQWRQRSMGDKTNNVSIGGGATAGDEDDDRTAASKGGVGMFDTEITEAANELRENYVEKGTPSDLVGDPSLLTPSRLPGLNWRNLGGMIGGIIKGPLATADHGCALYKIIRIASYSSRARGAISLMRTFSTIMQPGDAIKAMSPDSDQINLIASNLLRKSTQDGSKGKDFSQSGIAEMALYGKKPSNPEAISPWSLGSPKMKALTDVRKFLEANGITAEVCSTLGRWYVQLGLAVGGVLSCIITGGGTCVEGAIQSAIVQSTVGILKELLLPKLISIAAGLMFPDLTTHPGGGYAIGNAMVPAAEAFFSTTGRSIGGMPLTKTDLESLKKLTREESATMAKVNAMESKQMGVFNPNNPSNIQSRLAIATMPYLNQSSVGSLASILTNTMLTTFSKIPSLFSYSAMAADGQSIIEGTCDDPDTNRSGLAVGHGCGYIVGLDPEIMKNPSGKYNEENVKVWMMDHDFATFDDEGKIIEAGEEYTEYIESCQMNESFVVAAGEGVDIVYGDERKNTYRCYNNPDLEPEDREKYRYFRALYAIESANETMAAIDDDSLGNSTVSSEQNSDRPVTGEDLSDQYENGRIPQDKLCSIGGGHYLSCDAAQAFKQLDQAYYGRFQRHITVTDSYRSLAAQEDLYRRKPSLAARPGTSNHGWGKAVDLGGGINDFNTPQHNWMRGHAGEYGWENPTWAHQGRGREEPWHWEFGVEE